MKGSPMQRNFGIGSPLHDEKVVKGGTKETVTVSGGDKPERHADKYKRVASTKGSDKTKLSGLSTEYGGTWTRQSDSRAGKGGTLYKNQDGQTVKDVAIAQGKKAAQDKKDYIAANTTKK